MQKILSDEWTIFHQICQYFCRQNFMLCGMKCPDQLHYILLSSVPIIMQSLRLRVMRLILNINF